MGLWAPPPLNLHSKERSAISFILHGMQQLSKVKPPKRPGKTHPSHTFGSRNIYSTDSSDKSRPVARMLYMEGGGGVGVG